MRIGDLAPPLPSFGVALEGVRTESLVLDFAAALQIGRARRSPYLACHALMNKAPVDRSRTTAFLMI